MTMLEAFVKERNEALFSLDRKKIEAYMIKYGETEIAQTRGTLRKEGAPRRLLYLSLISSLKRCNPCGYAVFSLLRSVRCRWKASSISSGVSSWRMPTPL